MTRPNQLILCIAMCVAWISIASAEECVKPEAEVTVPDGATASEAVMIAASKSVRAFVNDGQAYVDCLQPSIDAATESVRTAVKDSEEHQTVSRELLLLVSDHDAMVKAMQDLADDFNTALKAYNARTELD